MITTTWRYVMVGDHFLGSDGRPWRITMIRYLYRGWGDRNIVDDWEKVAEIDPSPTLESLQVTAQGPIDTVGYRQISVTERIAPDASVTLSYATHMIGGVRAALFVFQEAGLFPEAME